MKEFVKKKLYHFVHRIVEDLEKEKKNINEQKRAAYYCQTAMIDPSAKIEDLAIIANNQHDKTKIRIGKESWLKGQLLVLAHGGEITIGNHCFIGDDTKIWSSLNIKIGNRVLISHNVNIHDNISHSLSAAYRHEEFKFIFKNNTHFKDLTISEAPVVIEDDVWIGFNAVILKGVTIGQGAVIGANTIVTQNVPSYAVVVGNPARIIKQAKP